MMNPYTQSLLMNITDKRLKHFVKLWDSFEAQAIKTYRNAECPPDKAEIYRSLVLELRAAYPEWQEALTPHWKASRIKGQTAIRDPFASLLELGTGSEWIGNGDALRLLPPAREAVNRYLLSVGENT